MPIALLVWLLGQTGGDPMALPSPLPVPPAAEPAAPSATTGLGLAALERIASQHNPTLAQALTRIEQARGTVDQAGRYPNPYVIWNASNLGQEGTAGTQSGFLQQPIITGGKIRKNRARYEVDVEIARWSLVEQQWRVLNGVRLRYLQVLAQQRVLALRGGLLRMADDVVRTTRAKVESGHASEPDLLMAENEAEQLRLDLDQLRERYRNTWREFAAFLGCPDMPPTPLLGNLEPDRPAPAWEPSLARILGESPEVKIAELRVVRQQRTLRREQAEPIPDLILRAGAGYDPTNTQAIGVARIYVEAPLWDRNQGNIYSAQHAVLDMKRDLDRVRLSVQQRLARSYNHYQTSAANVRRYRESILPRARRAFELYYKSFQDEDASFSRVQSSQSAYAQALIKYIEELLELRRAEVAIDGLLLVEESIEAGTLRPPSQPLPRAPTGGGAPVGGAPSRQPSA
jgi:cobalt-zinc-cadmium efflux system outer membrane protein